MAVRKRIALCGLLTVLLAQTGCREGVGVAAGQAPAGEEDICPSIRSSVYSLISFVKEMDQVMTQSQEELRELIGEADRAKLEALRDRHHQAAISKGESLKELETYLVIRRELGCLSAPDGERH